MQHVYTIDYPSGEIFMKNNKSLFLRASSMLLSLLILSGSLMIDTAKVSAASDTWELLVADLYVGKSSYIDVYNVKGGKTTAKVLYATSTNSKVATVKEVVIKGVTYYKIKGKKKGKAEIKSIIKTSKGDVLYCNKTVKVRSYPNHIKSLKINGKKVSLKGSKRYGYTAKCNKSKVTVRIALQNGWSIEKVYGSLYKKNSDKAVSISKIKKKIKTGKSIKFSKKYQRIHIGIVMKKGNRHITYNINLSR